MPNREIPAIPIEINSKNIRLVMSISGLDVKDKTDEEVLNLLVSHFREFAAMKDAVRLVLIFAKNYGHTA